MPETGSDIVVEGWSQRYARAFAHLLGIEGGHVNDPVDRGGETKYGISLRFLRVEGAFDEDGNGRPDFDLDMDGDIDGADIRLLTIGDARYLYLKCFWMPLGCDGLPMPIGEILFDQAVNGGAFAARKLLQRAINLCLARMGESLITVDGRIGPDTLDAMTFVLAKRGMTALIEACRVAAADRYRLIAQRYPSQKRFLKGWLRRAERLGR
ncbi:MAG: glycoside hydrolase family 108 protein [Sphingomonadaceae bacterium]